MKPTYEELEAKLLETAAKLFETQRLLKLAIERITALEEQINKNSNNSSKPPSSDKKPNSSGKKKTRKSRGKGVNRKTFSEEEIDVFTTCSLEKCPCCGSDHLSDLNESLVLQQAELPEVKATITQFTLTKHKCHSCGGTSFGELPRGVPNSAFGPRLMALLASLTGVFHLSKREAIQLMHDLYGVEICEGSVINIEERVTQALNEPYERIYRHVIQGSLCKHFDETSWRNLGKSHYVWVASTSHATCLHIDPNRSKKAFQRFARDLGKGPIVTDRYSVYEHIDRPHQYCLAHLIRDCRKYAERNGSDGEIGQALEKELRQICKNHREFREGTTTKQTRNNRFRHQKLRLENLLLDGFIEGSAELASLCDRLLDNFSKLWTFSRFTDVEPTNNLAERDVRKVVLWRKKSYGTRSDRGQRFVERISSVTLTLKKAGKAVLGYVQEAVITFYQGKSAPMINPSHSY